MLLKSALKYSKYKKSENYQEEFNRICLLSGLPHPGKVLESPGFFLLSWKVLEFCI